MEKKVKRPDNYQHRRHNKNLLLVHLIFVTKYRKQILCHNLRDDIKQWLFETAGKYHWYIKKMETDRDHVHILLQYKPTDCITDIVSRLKQYSTYYSWNKYGGMLSGYYWKEKTFWSDGYFAASVGTVSQCVIERYIETQG